MLVNPRRVNMMSMMAPVMRGKRFVLRFSVKCSVVVFMMLAFLLSRANDTRCVKM